MYDLKKNIILPLCLFGATLVNANTGFSQQQKEEIQQIVKEYLLSEPEIMYEISAVLQNKERKKVLDNALNSVLQNKEQFINLIEKSPSIHNGNYDVTIVEFFDYRCSHCKRSAQVIEDLLKEQNNIRVVFMEFPIFDGESLIASKAALAAEKQNLYYEYHKELMSIQSNLTEDDIFNLAKKVGLNVDKLKSDMNSVEIVQHIRNTFMLARSMGLNVTPAFLIFDDLNKDNPNFSYDLGYLSKYSLTKKINEVRND